MRLGLRRVARLAQSGSRLLPSVACVLLTSTAVAAAQWGEILKPTRGQVLHAGEWAEVEWTALPAGVEEFELLLSLDNGAGTTVRLTPQLDPSLGVYRWRVPNLPAEHARIRLRVGIDENEVLGPLGEPFEIVGESARPLVGLRWREGEWWTTAVTWPRPPLEHLPVRLRATPSATAVTVVALNSRESSATVAVANEGFERSSPPRRAVRVAPPVTDQSPLVTPKRE